MPSETAQAAPAAKPAQAAQAEAPPFAVLLERIMGSMLTQAIYVAAKLEIADILAGGPLPAEEIAQRADADPDATYRLLRLLASYSIFGQQSDGRFALTPMADALREDSPVSMRGMALLLGHPVHWADWSHLAMAVQTGEPVLPKLHGVGGYEFLAANPEFAVVFEGGMGNLSKLETEPIAAGYDFSRFRTIVDVFGGQGALLAAILARAPGTRGILADWRTGALKAAEFLRNAGVANRCTIETTDFFAKPPGGGDAYILKHIVHEWPEAQSLEILSNVRDVMAKDGKLLLIEFVLPDGPEQHPGKLVDLWLMILMGGRERTAAQYATLLGNAGFRLSRVIPTASAAAIIEAVPG